MHERDHAADGRRGETKLGRVDILRKGFGCGADSARLAGAVDEGPGEFAGGGGRRAQGEGEDGVDFFHHFGLCVAEGLLGCRAGVGGGGGGGGEELAQDKGVFAQLGEDDAVDDAARAGVEGVRVQRLRDEAVLVNEIIDHVPLAAVAEGLVKQALHET